MKNGLVYLRPSRLTYVRHTGCYAKTIPAAWADMMAWLIKTGLNTPAGRSYGLLRDCPSKVAAENCRFDACIELDPLFEERAIRELGAQTLPGGSYLRVRNTGAYSELNTKLSDFHKSFDLPEGLKLDERRPLVAIYLDNPLRADDASVRAEICLPVGVSASRGEDGGRAAA